MTPEEVCVCSASSRSTQRLTSTLSLIEAPPGRSPRHELLQANAWYERLSADERAHLRAVNSMTAHQAVVGVLAVLDGVRAAESTSDKGTFKLTFCKNGQEWQLSPPRGEMLHDLLAEIVERSPSAG